MKENMTISTNLTPNALAVLHHRPYLQPGETPDQLFGRVAHAVAGAEPTEDRKWRYEQDFYKLLSSLRFLPNTPTLVHAGLPEHQYHCLSACFVLPVEDSLESIMQTLKDAALVVKSGGGVGFGLSKLRPKGDTISTNVAGIGACGLVAVLQNYSQVLGTLSQAAVRQGAFMAQLHVSHPDILEFIHCKRNGGLDNFNISVQVTDYFMKMVEEDGEWFACNPRTGDSTVNVSIMPPYKARFIWKQICEAAWATGDPGVVFIDRVQEAHPNPHLGVIESSNPCGEEFLEPYGSCNLGSINLAAHFDAEKNNVDWDKLRETVTLGVRFLDDVIDVNWFPLPQLSERNQETRRIGLGVMGWADLLAYWKIPYDSEQAVELAESLGKQIHLWAEEESGRLADEKGIGRKVIHQSYIRNSSITTIAPTGSISIIAGCSSGIEPYYSLAWERKALWNGDGSYGKNLMEYPVPLVQEIERRYGEDKDRIIGDLNALREGTPLGWTDAYYRTAHDIAPEWHVRHQAAWQQNTDNGVSKTINLPASATVEDVDKAFKLAYELRCKAITVYRDGSKGGQVLESSSNHKRAEFKTGFTDDLLSYKTYGRTCCDEIVKHGIHSHSEGPWTDLSSEEKQVLENHKRQQAEFKAALLHVPDDPISQLGALGIPEEAAKNILERKEVEPKLNSAGIHESSYVQGYDAGHGFGVAQGKVDHAHSQPQPRPVSLTGVTTEVETGHGTLYITVNQSERDGQPFEVFVNGPDSNSCSRATAEALGRILSIALRAGVDPKALFSQLRGIDCGHTHWMEGKQVLSVPDAVGQTLECWVRQEPAVSDDFHERVTQWGMTGGDSSHPNPYTPEQLIDLKRHQESVKSEGTLTLTETQNRYDLCPQCSGSLQHKAGCFVCASCGYSSCE